MDVSTRAWEHSGGSTGFEDHIKGLIVVSQANIARIESQIRDLVALRDRERGIIATLRTVIAPIRKLPAELLVEIFTLTAHCDAYKPDRVMIVLPLTQVCAYWRQLVHTTPQIWTGVLPVLARRVFTRSPRKIYMEKDMSLALTQTGAWLDRSSPLSIPVSFFIPLTFPAQNLNIVPLMQMLISKANRWRDATLTAPNLSILSTLGPNTLEKLERVDLTSAKLSNTVDAFLSAPLLRKATICLPDISFLLMPWSQLTTLSLTTDSPDRCLEVLQQCTNLVSAEFNTYAWEEDFDTDIQTVATLPNLTALHLSSDSGIVGHFTPFLRCLTLPALTDFGLSASETLLWPAVVATEFQLRSPLITSLQLLLSAIDSDELLSVLRCTPLLKSLELICCYDCVDDNLLDALRYRASDASHLTPRLDSLLLSEIENSFQESYLEDMIRSRWWSDEQLLLFTSPPPVARWVSLTCTIKESMGHPMDLEFVERMEAFRSEGLRLTLR